MWKDEKRGREKKRKPHLGEERRARKRRKKRERWERWKKRDGREDGVGAETPFLLG